MPPRRSLARDEARLWAAVAQTVRPLGGKSLPTVLDPPEPLVASKAAARLAGPASTRVAKPPPSPRTAERIRPLDVHGLDAGWERKLAKAVLQPDFTLDLHGHTVGAAHARLDQGLGQATAMGARLVLVITGRPRPVEAADRGTARGAIRAKVLDWLALGPHAGRIAAVRPAQRRHGGAGALYVVLRRPK